MNNSFHSVWIKNISMFLFHIPAGWISHNRMVLFRAIPQEKSVQAQQKMMQNNIKQIIKWRIYGRKTVLKASSPPKSPNITLKTPNK